MPITTHSNGYPWCLTFPNTEEFSWPKGHAKTKAEPKKKNKLPNYPIWALALSRGKPWAGLDSSPRPSDFDHRCSTDWATRPEREILFHGVEASNYGFRKELWPCSTDEGNLLSTATHPILLLRSFYHQCYTANVYYVTHNSPLACLEYRR